MGNSALMRQMTAEAVVLRRFMHASFGKTIHEISMTSSAKMFRIAHKQMFKLPFVWKMACRAFPRGEGNMNAFRLSSRFRSPIVAIGTKISHILGEEVFLR